jgi:dolichol-phosphate mannosyltransferase
MPVFNEQASILQVTRAWFDALVQSARDFVLLAIDDGSTDGTLAILNTLQSELGARLEVISRANRGHGQTCIEGYKAAIERNIPFVLQIDSDGQSNPAHFAEFWAGRDNFDVIYGKRTRQDGTRRIVASAILRKLLKIVTKVDCVDANVPYRLMNTTACANSICAVPSDLSLANIALAVILRINPKIRHGSIPINFPPRLGGEPSVPFFKFAAKGLELYVQLKRAGIAGAPRQS